MPGDEKTSLDLLVIEANRQLDICNACRYCEGYCAVYPALERRTLLSAGDVTQLANLCHDCRACFDACMYAPPHEFAVNIPKALSEVRLESYGKYVWPQRVPGVLRGWTGIAIGVVLSSAVTTALALAYAGPSGLLADRDVASSPYDLIPYPVLLVLLLAPSLFSVSVMAAAGWRYWTDVCAGSRSMPVRAVARAVLHSLTLRNLRGGGGECYYPQDDVPSPARRRLHFYVAYGFGLCTLSTSSAAVLQDFLGSPPPYPVFSLPVISGVIGGLGIVIGCTGLLRLKAKSSQITSFAQMTVKDYGLLVALDFLAISGFATLLTREGPGYGVAYVVHLAAIVLTFAAAPYSKFVHLVFRFLALVRDNVEQRHV